MIDATAVAEYVQARRAEVEAALWKLLPSPRDASIPLAEAMRYSLEAGGKRLRPVLCLASAEAVGGARNDAMPAACALELIHTYSLVHDDLPAMDNDTMRRGKPTLHVVAGEGMAILAGDGLLTQAFHVLASGEGNPGHVLRAIRVIAEAAGPIGMVGGQAIDLASVSSSPRGPAAPMLDAAGLAAMHAKKTGALIRASAVSGAVLAGGSDTQIAAIEQAATEFGLAFQIVDDILDVEGDAAQLGKSTGKDAAAGKPTYPAFFGIAKSRSMANDCIARAADALGNAGMADSWLLGIGRWIVERRN